MEWHWDSLPVVGLVVEAAAVMFERVERVGEQAEVEVVEMGVLVCGG